VVGGFCRNQDVAILGTDLINSLGLPIRYWLELARRNLNIISSFKSLLFLMTSLHI
jgi:hypothetical protein